MYSTEKELSDETDLESSIEEDQDHDLNKPISKEEIERAINKLKCGKAPGIDGVTAEMLKAGDKIVLDFFEKLFNQIFNEGIYPTEWAKAIVVPIFKKGDRDNADNYRGVSLISILCKCYTSILNARLYLWLEDTHTIVENQAGFRKNHSTVDHIFTLYSVAQKCLNSGKRKLYVAFVDFKKAFDSVQHNKLLEAVYKTGVKGKFFCALRAMYDSLLSCVRINNQCTDFFHCPTGVRQGCVLSPTLFSLFINNLAQYIDESGVHGIQLLPNMTELFILLFADDVALLSNTPTGLQSQLNSLKTCCDRLKLKVNKEKTKIMVFRKGGYLAQCEKWVYDGEPVEVVNSYTYLGFTFTTMLSCELGTASFVTKGKKAVHLLSRAYLKCKEMSQSTFFKIFDAKVQSILLYSSEVWGLHRLDNIEKVHLLACKRYLGVPLKTPNKLVYGELGRYPLFINTTVRAVKYWLHLSQMEADRLPKQCYQMLLSLDGRGKKCWITNIKEILSSSGFQFVWINQGVGNEQNFLNVFKQRLIDMFMQDWSSTLRDGNRYELYRTFKDIFSKEAYLANIDIVCFRIAFSHIRLGVLPINCNMYRYSENPSDKQCICGSQEENEHHFLYVCPVYDDLRLKFLKDFLNLPLSRLLDGNSKHMSRHVGKFVFHAIRRRQIITDS